MRTTLILILFLSCTAMSAQTRRIAHRSHGGTNVEHYDGVDGNYGIPYHVPTVRMVKVHLESGRDTVVSENDSLARPYYVDSVRRIYQMPDQKKKIRKVDEVGNVAGRLVM